MVLALSPDSRATLRKVTPRSFEGAAGGSKASRAEKDVESPQLGLASARILSNGNTIAERLNDLRKARREEDKSNGTFPALARAKICPILYSKGKMALQAEGASKFPASCAQREFPTMTNRQTTFPLPRILRARFFMAAPVLFLMALGGA